MYDCICWFLQYIACMNICAVMKKKTRMYFWYCHVWLYNDNYVLPYNLEDIRPQTAPPPLSYIDSYLVCTLPPPLYMFMLCLILHIPKYVHVYVFWMIVSVFMCVLILVCLRVCSCDIHVTTCMAMIYLWLLFFMVVSHIPI